MHPARHRIRRPAHAALAAVLGVAASFIPALGANAAAQEKVPVCAGFTPESPCRLDKPQVNWFWSSNAKATVCVPPPEGAPDTVPGACGPVSVTGGIFGNAAGAASPITSGHLGVALKDGTPDMRAYVKLDLGRVPPTADLQSVVLTMNVSLPSQGHAERHRDVGGKLPATLFEDRANIIACAVTEPWANMAVDGGDPPIVTRIDQDKLADNTDPNDGLTTQRVEPTSDCGLQVTGRRALDGKTWSFDLTNMAKVWRSGTRFNEGVVLMPLETGPAQNWTVEFHGQALTVEATAGSGTDEPTVWVKKTEESFGVVTFVGGQDPILPPPPPPPPAPDIGGGLPTFGNDTPAPPIDSAPPPATTPPPTTPVATTAAPGFWWAMFPLGILALGIYSSAIGADPLAAATGDGNRVARVLRRRRVGDAG